MKIYRLLEKFILRFVSFLWSCFIKIHEKKNIKIKKHLYKNVTLTDEQKKQIDDFYLENYGKKISHKWHRLYQSYTGNFDYRYFPEPLFTTKMELLGNKRIQVLPLENKALLVNFVKGMEDAVRIPKTYIMCVQGRYYDADGNIIDKEAAIEVLKNLNGGEYSAICKRTVDTNSGRDVRLIDIKHGVDALSNEEIHDVLSSMGSDFVVQERIKPHPAFEKLYPGSINTLRVISYQASSHFNVAPIVMRIGRSGYVDNAHAGGVFIGVTNEGRLLSEAFTEDQERYSIHPTTGVAFEGYLLPRIPDIIQCAVKMHKNYPSMRFVSWDFTVDKDENIVLIEANLHSQAVWISQMAHGKGFFGEDTAEMLRLISSKKNS